MSWVCSLLIDQHETLTSAVAASGDTERVVARLAANDLDSGKFSKLHYKIIDVSDGATTSFRYDEQTNELKAVGALRPGHRYQVCARIHKHACIWLVSILIRRTFKVVIQAEDGGGRSGRTVALVFASPDASHSEDELQSSGSIESTQPTPLLPIVPFTAGTTRRMPSTSKTEPSEPVQTMVTELSEATPPNSVVAILGVSYWMQVSSLKVSPYRTKIQSPKCSSKSLTATVKGSSA